MTSALHSVYFLKKDGWTTAKARKWLKDNGMKPIKRVHKIGDELRYRLIPPEEFKSFITKVYKSVHFVIGFYDKKKQKGGNAGLLGFADFMGPELKATGWLSQTADNMSNLPFAPNWTEILGKVAADQLRKQGY